MNNSDVDRLLYQFTLRRHVSTFFEHLETNSVFVEEHGDCAKFFFTCGVNLGNICIDCLQE